MFYIVKEKKYDQALVEPTEYLRFIVDMNSIESEVFTTEIKYAVPLKSYNDARRLRDVQSDYVGINLKVINR